MHMQPVDKQVLSGTNETCVAERFVTRVTLCPPRGVGALYSTRRRVAAVEGAIAVLFAAKTTVARHLH